MYIELFIADNLLMNLLIMRLAAALLKVSPPLIRQLTAGGASAVYAALSAYMLPKLGSLPARLIPLAVMSLGLPAKSPRGMLACMAATLFSTLVVGGLACCVALLSGGGAKGGFISGGVGLRAALVIAASASLLPRTARRILRRGRINSGVVTLTVTHRGIERSFEAIVDTGNTLREPMTGLPVAVLYCEEFKKFAALPVRAGTAAGECTLMAFRPERMSVDGVEVKGFAAIAAGPKERAVVPPELLPYPFYKK